jgi:chitin synthase
MASMVVACFLFSMGNKPASYALQFISNDMHSCVGYFERSKMKYKLTSIFFAILMLYLFFCTIKCAVAAASQGGSTGRLMVLSFLVTYGGIYQMINLT